MSIYIYRAEYTKEVFAYDDTTRREVRVTYTNNSSVDYYNVTVSLCGILPSGYPSTENSSASITIAKVSPNVFMPTFMPKVVLYFDEDHLPPYPVNGRGMGFYVKIDYEDADGNKFYTYDQLDGFYVVNRVYNPSIDIFNPVRYSTIHGTISDEGMQVMADADIGMNIGDDEDFPSSFSLQATCIPDGDETQSVVIDLKSRFRDLINGVTSSLDLIPGDYSDLMSWDVTLYFGDEYENDSVTVTLPSISNVPLHISGAKKGGVSVGAISTSTDDNPKFECHPPAYFYGGIDIADGGSYEERMVFDDDAPFDWYSEDESCSPWVRRFGHVVEIRGEIKPTKTLTGNSSEHPIFTLPHDCIPAHSLYILQQGSTQSIWMLRIYGHDIPDSAGRVMFSRYRKGASWADAGTSTWLPFHAMWIV